ncbi:hypothetical protein BXZ70DRAFT_911446 [Cristinia sonorae]|uniref:Uncharacterized protein n=1 Tax=Cristinia sonorae TaxID=1940300 RepID=A0A8K0UDS1_9AGAR|nr:hypothetical protein BXZ70DRAFT_911446 [Cristinia sonorae]
MAIPPLVRYPFPPSHPVFFVHITFNPHTLIDPRLESSQPCTQEWNNLTEMGMHKSAVNRCGFIHGQELAGMRGNGHSRITFTITRLSTYLFRRGGMTGWPSFTKVDGHGRSAALAIAHAHKRRWEGGPDQGKANLQLPFPLQVMPSLYAATRVTRERKHEERSSGAMMNDNTFLTAFAMCGDGIADSTLINQMQRSKKPKLDIMNHDQVVVKNPFARYTICEGGGRSIDDEVMAVMCKVVKVGRGDDKEKIERERKQPLMTGGWSVRTAEARCDAEKKEKEREEKKKGETTRPRDPRDNSDRVPKFDVVCGRRRGGEVCAMERRPATTIVEVRCGTEGNEEGNPSRAHRGGLVRTWDLDGKEETQEEAETRRDEKSTTDEGDAKRCGKTYTKTESWRGDDANRIMWIPDYNHQEPERER